MYFVHFNPATGQVMQWSQRISNVKGLVGAIVQEPAFPNFDRKKYRVDLPSYYFDDYLQKPFCKLIELPPDPITTDDIRKVRNAELTATDQYMIPDRPVPDREAWKAYRQALRDLTHEGTVNRMLEMWPTRPDGHNMRVLLNLGNQNG